MCEWDTGCWKRMRSIFRLAAARSHYQPCVWRLKARQRPLMSWENVRIGEGYRWEFQLSVEGMTNPQHLDGGQPGRSMCWLSFPPTSRTPVSTSYWPNPASLQRAREWVDAVQTGQPPGAQSGWGREEGACREAQYTQPIVHWNSDQEFHIYMNFVRTKMFMFVFPAQNLVRISLFSYLILCSLLKFYNFLCIVPFPFLINLFLHVCNFHYWIRLIFHSINKWLSMIWQELCICLV